MPNIHLLDRNYLVYNNYSIFRTGFTAGAWRIFLPRPLFCRARQVDWKRRTEIFEKILKNGVFFLKNRKISLAFPPKQWYNPDILIVILLESGEFIPTLSC